MRSTDATSSRRPGIAPPWLSSSAQLTHAGFATLLTDVMCAGTPKSCTLPACAGACHLLLPPAEGLLSAPVRHRHAHAMPVEPSATRRVPFQHAARFTPRGPANLVTDTLPRRPLQPSLRHLPPTPRRHTPGTGHNLPPTSPSSPVPLRTHHTPRPTPLGPSRRQHHQLLRALPSPLKSS